MDWSACLRAARLQLRAAPVASGVAVAAYGALALAPAVMFTVVGRLIDALSEPRRGLAPLLAAVAGVLLVQEVLPTLGGMCGARASERVADVLDRDVMRAVGSVPGLRRLEDPAFADDLQVAEWAGERAGSLFDAVVRLVGWIGSTVGMTVVAFRLIWWAPLTVVGAVVPRIALRWRHAGRRARAEEAGAGRMRFASYLFGLNLTAAAGREIRVFGFAEWLGARRDEAWNDGVRDAMADLDTELRRELVLDLVRVAAVAAPLIALIVRTPMSAGRIATGLLALLALWQAVEQLPWSVGNVRTAAAHLPSAFRLADLSEPTLASTDVLEPLRDAIRLEDVSFSYPLSERPVLDGVSLELRAGTSTAIVGVNGAGKTTLVKLLCGLYRPGGGRISWDGRDLRDVDPDALWRRTAVVFQDFVRLPWTARDNVSVGGGDRLVREAADLAGAASMVERLPSGWETVLSTVHGGVDLSGGQWQRIALARAMAARLENDASLLILDEPTAALDVRVEQELYERFSQITGGSTTLLVSHRLSTVRNADRIVVIDGGRVAECGTHDELVAADGLYARMFRLQADRFRDSP